MPNTVLAIDPIATNRIRLAALLNSAHYGTVTAASTRDVPGALSDFDLVVLGLTAEPPILQLASVTNTVNALETPILCLDQNPTPLRRLLALKSGAREVLDRAAPEDLFLTRLRGLLREGEAARESERRRMTAASFGFSEPSASFLPQHRIACIGVEPHLADLLASSLPYEVAAVSSEAAVSGAGDHGQPDAYIVATGRDPQAVTRLLPELRDRNHSRHAPVLTVFPADMPLIATRALDLGASDTIEASATGEEFGLRVDAMLNRKRLADLLRKSEEHSYRLAATDPLTGLYNRRYAESYLSDLLARGLDTGNGFVMMIIDLDRFKSVNDDHGHAAGDRVLKEMAHRLKDNLRAKDLISRHGGEEFLVLLPNTALEEGVQTAERLRAAIANDPVILEDGTKLSVTASFGVTFTEFEEQDRSRKSGTTGAVDFCQSGLVGQSFEAADAALYQAKAMGRNRVVLSDA